MTAEFRASEIYTANEMNEFIGGKHQGGIRYAGHFPDIERIGVVIGGGADAIYADQIAKGSITYVGEGQEGDQRLTYGNRALAWAYFHDMAVHVFLNQGKNKYRYLGEHHVESVSVTIAPDRNDIDRGAFVFALTPTVG